MRRPQTELPCFAYPRLIRTGREGQESKPPRQPSPAPRLLPWQRLLFGCLGHIKPQIIALASHCRQAWPGHTCNHAHMAPTWGRDKGALRLRLSILPPDSARRRQATKDARCRRWKFPRGILEARPNRRARANGPTRPPRRHRARVAPWLGLHRCRHPGCGSPPIVSDLLLRC